MLKSILKNIYRKKTDYLITRYNFSQSYAKLITLSGEIFIVFFAFIFFTIAASYTKLLFITTITIVQTILFIPKGNTNIKQAYLIDKIYKNKAAFITIPLFILDIPILYISVLVFLIAYLINRKYIFDNHQNPMFKNGIDYVIYPILLLTLFLSSEHSMILIFYYIIILAVSSFFKTTSNRIILTFLIGITLISLASTIEFISSVILYVELIIFLIFSTKAAGLLEIEHQLNLRRCKLNLVSDLKAKKQVLYDLNYINIILYILSCIPLMIYITNSITPDLTIKIILIVSYGSVIMVSYIATCFFSYNKFFIDKKIIRNSEDYLNYKFSSLFAMSNILVVLPILFEEIYNRGDSINTVKSSYLIGLIISVILLVLLYIKKTKNNLVLLVGDK